MEGWGGSWDTVRGEESGVSGGRHGVLVTVVGVCPGRPAVGCAILHDRANRGPTASHPTLCLCKWCTASMVNTRPLVQAPLLAETNAPLVRVGG